LCHCIDRNRQLLKAKATVHTNTIAQGRANTGEHKQE
jgi:hypothetical protein